MQDFCNSRLIPSKNLFKKELKSHFLDKLADDYKCGRLLCPHGHLSSSGIAVGCPPYPFFDVIAVGVSPFLVPLLGPLLPCHTILLGCLGSFF